MPIEENEPTYDERMAKQRACDLAFDEKQAKAWRSGDITLRELREAGSKALAKYKALWEVEKVMKAAAVKYASDTKTQLPDNYWAAEHHAYQKYLQAFVFAEALK